MRKLLPYEHQLIEALGITKEEYLAFVAIQQEYKDPKVGTALDVRNADGGLTVGIALTIIGTLFQVAAAFLFRPEVPDLGGERRRQRQQRFAPSFGFNSAQELARYGDPVNLVYTRADDKEGRDRDDFNPNGGVRVAGALVWSSIENLGSRQFMQLQMVLGASAIKRIDLDKTAFGQLALSTLNPGLVWIFYKNGTGDPGPLVFGDNKFGNLKLFPEELHRDNDSNSTFVCRVRGRDANGFSQAYSPTTSTSLGVYDPIPVNVDVLTRNSKGKKRDAPINIKITANGWDAGRDQEYKVGQTIDIKFESSGNKDGDSDARGIAKDIRRQTAEALTYGATYMLGAAKFQLISFPENSGQDVDDGDVTARFECIEPGHRPTADYGVKRPITQDEDLRKDLEEAERILSNDGDPDGETIQESLRINAASLSYRFDTTETVEWTNEIDKKKTYSFSRAGSIEHTKDLMAEFLSEKPTLDVQKLIDEIEDDITLAKEEIDDILNGEFDEQGQLEKDIDAALEADADTTRLKRNIGFINEKIQKIKEDRKPNLDKKTPANILKDEAFKDNEGGTKSQRNVLSRSTSAGFKEVRDYEDKLDRLRARREKRRNTLIDRARKKYVKELRSKSRTPFTGLSGNYYGSGGLRAMERRLKQLPSEGRVTDRVGTKAVRQAFEALKKQKREALQKVRNILENFDDEYVKQLDNNFFTKCLVKCESASYETVSECNAVRFSIKSRLFRRVSGRQKKYAEKKAPEGYKDGDNGVKGRMAFFRVSYKSDADASYEVLPVIFAIRHGAESDFYNQLNFRSQEKKKYSFKFDPVYDAKAETETNGQKRFGFIENSDKVADYSRGLNDGDGFAFSWHGRNVLSINEWGFPNLEERGPRYTNEWDMFSVNTDTQVQFSHESGPELSITAVTEQQEEEANDLYENKYSNLSMLSIAVSAGRGIQDLRNITAFVTQGKKSYKVGDLTAPANDSTCFAPDIFVDTVLDEVHGVGKYTDSLSLDQESLKLAKSFCKNNNLPVQEGGGSIRLCMDGVIADASSWRSFWAENAPFSLLELARKNGADTLVPAIPVNNSGAAAESNGLPVPIEISALFTTGNILEGSYKEEFLDYGSSTQDLIASVLYRDQSKDEVFSTNKSVEVKRKDLKDDGLAIRQTFDASQFVTQREQAILFGKLLVNQRNLVEKAIEFKTFPSEAAIEPGAFIYVDIGMKEWDRYSTGIVMEGGVLNVPIQDKIAPGTYSFLFYDPTTGDVNSSSHQVDDDVAVGVDAKNIGRMFVMGASKPNQRVYRVSEVAIEEDGEISVKAVEYPCFEEGGQTRARIADFRSSNFDVS
jgi:hypothetical protein